MALLSTSRVQNKTKARRREAAWGWAFLLPFAIFFTLFLLIPLVWAFWLSMHTSSILGGDQFSGLANYVRAAADPLFLGGLLRVGVFVLLLVPCELIVGLIAALVIDALATRFANIARLIVFLPYSIPVAIGAIMWGFLYSPSFGPLHQLLGSAAPDLLGSGIYASLTNIVVWQYSGYFMIIIYAALRVIDPALYEAARLDGAKPIQIALLIKLPLIASSLSLVVLFALIGALQFFTEPQILMNVSSGSITPNFTPNIYAYSLAFKFNEIGYASTISFALGIIVILFSAVFFGVTRRKAD